MGHMGFGMRFFSVEEEIEMLEGAKTTLEAQLGNINSRLKKLKA
jgi:chaperonin cofactor prefoldin